MMIDLDDLILNKDNPRKIIDDAMKKLCESIDRDPQFMELRPIVVDDDNNILGGNQRYKACKNLGMEEVPDDWVKRAEDLTDEQKKRFIVVDNAPEGMAGEWDYDILEDNYNVDDLVEMGFEEGLFEVEEEMYEEPEIKFTEEMMESSNYIVLLFNNDVDWLQAQTLFDIKIVKALDSKEGYEKKGIGRVLDGAEAIEKILEGEA